MYIMLGDVNEFEIMYKSGAKLGNTVNCYYASDIENNYVIMKSSDGTLLHAIAKFKKI